MNKIAVAFILGALCFLSTPKAEALIPCDSCTCSDSCTMLCGGYGSGVTCGDGFPCGGCGGGGCLVNVDTDRSSSDLVEQLIPLSPVTPTHGQALARLTWHLTQAVEEGRFGRVFAGETGFRLPTDSTRLHAPVLSFITQDHVDSRNFVRGYWAGAPDLVFEAIQISDLGGAMKARAQEWLAAGATAVVVVDSAARTLTVYRDHGQRQVLGTGDSFEVADLIPGWQQRISELFE